MDLTARFSNPSDSSQEAEEDAFESTSGGFSGSRPKQRQRRLEETEILKLVSQYQSGASMAQIARAMNIHRNTVVSHLQKHGIERRPKHKMTDLQISTAVASYKTGISLQALGDQFGFDKNTVSRQLKQAGITIRPRHETN